MTLQALVLVVSLLLIVTKFLDCYSTVVRLKLPEEEINPFARAVMMRMGKTATVWVVFAIVLIIVSIVGGFVYKLTGTLGSHAEGSILGAMIVWGYLFHGLGMAGIHTAVAHTNWTGRFNVITRVLARTYQGLGSRISGAHELIGSGN